MRRQEGPSLALRISAAGSDARLAPQDAAATAGGTPALLGDAALRSPAVEFGYVLPAEIGAVGVFVCRSAA